MDCAWELDTPLNVLLLSRIQLASRPGRLNTAWPLLCCQEGLQEALYDGPMVAVGSTVKDLP